MSLRDDLPDNDLDVLDMVAGEVMSEQRLVFEKFYWEVRNAGSSIADSVYYASKSVLAAYPIELTNGDIDFLYDLHTCPLPSLANAAGMLYLELRVQGKTDVEAAGKVSLGMLIAINSR